MYKFTSIVNLFSDKNSPCIILKKYGKLIGQNFVAFHVTGSDFQ